MENMLTKIAVFFGSSAIGLLVAALSLRGFHMTFLGFIIAAIVFSVAQAIVSPLMSKLMEKYASTLTSMVGLLSAFLALLIAHAVSGGLQIQGVGTWVLATLLVWIIPAIATVILARIFAKN